MRRTPELVAAPIANRQLVADLEALTDGFPEGTCLAVAGPGLSFGHRADVPMIPASTQKLLTATAALEVLGVEPPVLDRVERVLRDSDNDTAERCCTRDRWGGRWSRDVARRRRHRRTSSTATGLSRDNRVTCQLLVDLLRRPAPASCSTSASRSPASRGRWPSGSSTPTSSGVLRAKTGSLTSVAALAGVVEDDDPPLTFAFVVNAAPGTPFPTDVEASAAAASPRCWRAGRGRPTSPSSARRCAMADVPMPMFPLGTVLVPSAGLPLHVFEPRYRALVHDCLAGDQEFGVVLIERGSEVGGDDVRTDVGTVARIVEAEELARRPVGASATVGVRRMRVRRVAARRSLPGRRGGGLARSAARRRLRRRAGGRASRCCGAPSGWPPRPATPPRRPPIELADDPVLASYQAIAVAPLGPFDRHRLLAAETPDARVAQLADLLRDAIEVLELRLGGSGDG